MIENRFGCAESIELGTTSALRLMLDIDMRKPKTNATENNILEGGLHFAIFAFFYFESRKRILQLDLRARTGAIL
tara:strand:+ start:1113 stop:1337 length:225 start_codon:yes stop_codon:yes gene_type:complete